MFGKKNCLINRISLINQHSDDITVQVVFFGEGKGQTKHSFNLIEN